MTRARVVGVVGGSGGVGASVLACAVAVRAAQAAQRVVLVDGCSLGGGLDVLMGVEQEPGLRWPDLASVRGALDGHELAERLPVSAGVPVLSFDRARNVALPADSVQEVMAASCATADVVVVDLPTPADPLFDQLAGFVEMVVLVCGRGIVELAAASAMSARVTLSCDQVWLVVRTAGRGLEFADEVSGAIELPLLGGLRDDPALDADLLHGIPAGSRRRGPLVELADHVLLQLVCDERPVPS